MHAAEVGPRLQMISMRDILTSMYHGPSSSQGALTSSSTGVHRKVLKYSGERALHIPRYGVLGVRETIIIPNSRHHTCVKSPRSRVTMSSSSG